MESRKEATSTAWRPRKYVLAGMGVILGASALSIFTSIILQPAHISFSAANFYMRKSKDSNDGNVDGAYFAFNLRAYNPSRRAEVKYRNVLVSVQLKHMENPSVRKTSVPTKVSENFCQPRNNNNTFRVETLLDDQFYKFYQKNASATITVFAQARFKVIGLPTRLYNIRVSCEEVPIHFLTVDQSQIANCSAV